jgi:hypothetical protein
MAGNNVLRTMVSVSKFAWKTLKKTRHMLVVVKTGAAELEPQARVCISDKDRERRTCVKNDPSYEFIGEVILKINIV